MLGTTFLSELAIRLRDPGMRQWTEAHLVDALNASLRALTSIRPRACMVIEDIPLVAGAEQSVGRDVNEIVSIQHNLDPVSGTPGRGVILADRAIMDHDFPAWRTDTPASSIVHWFYEPEARDQAFQVWPPVTADVPDIKVRATLAKTPIVSLYTQAEINASIPLQASEAGKEAKDAVIPVHDVWLNAMSEWAMYHAQSRDDEATANFSKAAAHFRQFFSLLDVDVKIAMATRQVREATE